MGSRLRNSWQTVLLAVVVLGLAYWAWLAYQDVDAALQRLIP